MAVGGVGCEAQAQVGYLMSQVIHSEPIVRRAEATDGDAIDRFVARAYGPLAPWKGAERRSWQLLDNPFRSEHDNMLPIWLALDGAEVVGQIAAVPALLYLDGIERSAGWIVDVMVLASHRGMRLGHRLHDQVAASVPLLVTLTMAPATRRIAERAGCVTLAPTREFIRLVRLDASVVRRYLMVRTEHHPVAQAFARLCCDVLALHRVVAPLVNGYLRLVKRDRPARPRESVEITAVDGFDDEIDQFWNRVRPSYPAIFARDSRFLNWRFADSPGLRYRTYMARRSGECVGYMVLRRSAPQELPAGHIVDFLVSPGDTEAFEVLITHAEQCFGQDVAAISCVTSSPDLEQVLRRLNFRVARTVSATVVCRDAAVRARIEELRNDWYFTKGDHDWDQIHLG